MNKAIHQNLYLDLRIARAAKSYVRERKSTRRSFSLSMLVQDLLLRELRRQGVKLPQEFAE